MRTLLPLIALGLALPIALAGCGEVVSCANACQRAFRPDFPNCGVGAGLIDEDRALRDCEQECEDALRQNGDLNGYDPDDYDSVDRSQTFTLDNEAQAAAWMECVVETSCEDLNDGFCPGGGIN